MLNCTSVKQIKMVRTYRQVLHRFLGNYQSAVASLCAEETGNSWQFCIPLLHFQVDFFRIPQFDCISSALPQCHVVLVLPSPQWGAADAEIKVPSGENTELKRSPFQAWSRSVYSHTCYAYCQGFLPCLFLPFQSIHLHFFQNLSQFFPVLACRIK